MKVKFSPLFLATACGLSLFAQVSVAQTSIQLFNAVDTRLSPTTTTFAAPYTFNSTTVNLTCPASGILATLSGPLMNGNGTAPQLTAPDATPPNALQAGGNLLVDNNILVTVTPDAGSAGPITNVCTGYNQGTTYNNLPVPPLLAENCFTSGYAGPATANNYPPGPLAGQNPDTFLVPSGVTVDAAGGVAPIDISTLLVSGKQSVNIGITDEGGILTSSSIFLTTNCTLGGVTGPATITGNPIGSGDSLVQNFNFDTGDGQVVGFVYDVSAVNNPGNGAIPQTADAPVDPAIFKPDFVPGTSFATSNCLIHDGELLSDGVTHACKLYTLECTDPTSGTTSGANCPVSVLENEVIKDVFDGPPFSLPNIYTGGDDGPTFHEGIGLLMASETWSATSGGPCTFDPASGLLTLPCPQNLLTSFTGPGGFSGTGITTNPNSTFISIYGVPEDNTDVSVKGESPPHWNNTSTPKLYFTSTPPNFTKGAFTLSGGKLVPLPGAAKFVPAPIKSITYGVSSVNNPLPMPANEPITGDVTVTPSTPCPSPLPTAKTEPKFSPPAQQIGPLADGKYLIHYYAQDCAGTQELMFTMAPVTGIWSTNFYTHPIGIDTTPPVLSGLALSPTGGSYKVGSTVYATYSCSDLNTGSGVVLCGTKSYAHDTTYSTGPLKTQLNTSKVGGPYTVTVSAVDGAGNTVSGQVHYSVTAH